MPLVDYSSEEDEEKFDTYTNRPVGALTGETITRPASINNDRKRKAAVLPKLPTAFDQGNSEDNPSLHQGRKRTRPFVEGEYNAHLRISIVPSLKLRGTIDEITFRAQELCPGHPVHSMLDEQSTIDGRRQDISRSTPLALHISLTHPLALRRSQIPDFASQVSASISRWSSERSRQSRELRLGLAGHLSGYMNGKETGGEGEGGRAFLALRVASGHAELQDIVEHAIAPILEKYHLPAYHDNPEFHTSFAWCLLSPTAGSGNGESVIESRSIAGLKLLSPYTSDVLKRLSEEFGLQILANQPKPGWLVHNLELKIGKDIRTIPL